MQSTGYIIAAAGIVAVNEAVFVPVETGKKPWENFNWRIIPATVVLAAVLAGIEKLDEGFGAGLGLLVLMSVLVIPVGNAGTPLENAAKFVNQGNKVL